MKRQSYQTMTVTDLSLREILALFRRRRGLILGILLTCLAVGVVLSLVLPPAFEAQRVIQLEGRTQANPNNQPTDIVGVLAQSGYDFDVLTQIQVLESMRIIYPALEKIGYLDDKDWVRNKNSITRDDFDRFPKVSVQQIQTTNNVVITVEHQIDDYAFKMTEAIKDTYSEYIVGLQRGKLQDARTFVTARFDEERKALEDAEREFAQYRAENQVADSKTESDVRIGQLAEAQRKLSEAEADRDAAIAALAEIRSAFAATPATINNPTVIARVDVIERIESDLSALETQREGLLVNNFPDSERIKRVDAQIAEQRKRYEEVKKNRNREAPSTVRNPARDELQRSVQGSEAGVRASEAKVAALKAVVAERETLVREFSGILPKLRDFETRIGERQITIQRLIETVNAIRLRDNALVSPVEDITGGIPARKVRPSWAVNLILATLAGLVLGLIAALVRDQQLDKVNTTSEAVAISEKDILGRVPMRSAARDPLIADPQKARAFEAYRVLRNSVMIAAGQNGPRAFLVTSSVPKEGKSTVAGNLAMALALEGRRVILVDGNLRSPSVHKLFKLPREKGLAEVLAGTLSLDEALKGTNVETLSVVSAGADAPNPTELVGGPKMKEAIEALKAKADVVLIDGPASFGLADAQSLVAAAQDVLYIVEAEGPSKSQMQEAVGMIDFAGGKILGLVVNKDRMATQRAKQAR